VCIVELGKSARQQTNEPALTKPTDSPSAMSASRTPFRAMQPSWLSAASRSETPSGMCANLASRSGRSSIAWAADRSGDSVPGGKLLDVLPDGQHRTRKRISGMVRSYLAWRAFGGPTEVVRNFGSGAEDCDICGDEDSSGGRPVGNLVLLDHQFPNSGRG
jgi:hypothetical protein